MLSHKWISLCNVDPILLACTTCGAEGSSPLETFRYAACNSCKQPYIDLQIVLPQEFRSSVNAASELVIAVFDDPLLWTRRSRVRETMHYLANMRRLAEYYQEDVHAIFVPLDVEADIQWQPAFRKPAPQRLVSATTPRLDELNIENVPEIIIFNGSNELWRDTAPNPRQVQEALMGILFPKKNHAEARPQSKSSAEEPENLLTAEHILAKLERFEVLEERAGVQVGGLWATWKEWGEYGNIEISGELRTLDGSNFSRPLYFEVAIYDQLERVVFKHSLPLPATEVRNFRAFSFSASLPVPWGQVKSIRFYPEH